SFAILVNWVKLGAPWPEEQSSASSATATMDPAARIAAARATHWAYQPVRDPALPDVRTPAWSRSPIDRFVLATLEKNGLAPSTAADRFTLLRRVTFDLIGLPPTFEEAEAFAKDDRPDALARLVDRLLASPHYGERWGRHWLDIARYADTKG